MFYSQFMLRAGGVPSDPAEQNLFHIVSQILRERGASDILAGSTCDGELSVGPPELASGLQITRYPEFLLCAPHLKATADVPRNMKFIAGGYQHDAVTKAPDSLCERLRMSPRSRASDSVALIHRVLRESVETTRTLSADTECDWAPLVVFQKDSRNLLSYLYVPPNVKVQVAYCWYRGNSSLVFTDTPSVFEDLRVAFKVNRYHMGYVVPMNTVSGALSLINVTFLRNTHTRWLREFRNSLLVCSCAHDFTSRKLYPNID